MADLTAKDIGPAPGQLESVCARLCAKHQDEEIEWTSCPQNGCFDMCLLKVHKKDGVITAIDTDNTIHPNCAREDAYVDESEFYKGMFQHRACVRGRGWRKDVYSPNRIIYPMKRVGPRGSREFKRISWDEALDTIVQKYLEIREKYGPLSVWMDGLLGVSSDPWGAYLPGGALGAWGADSNEPHDFADTWTFGRTFAADTWTFDGGTEAMTLLDSKAIILWGVDIFLNYPEFAYYLILARDKGIPVIYIDPRYTWTAHHADQWIPIRPATDAAMYEAMAYTIFEEDLVDHEFVDAWVEKDGLERWRAYIYGEDDGVVHTPEWAEKICGVPAETIRGLARLIADGPVYMRLVWAAARMHFGENQAREHNYLMALTGNIGKNGTMGTGTAFGTVLHFPPPPPVYLGTQAPEYGHTNAVEAENWHHAILMREKYDAGEISLEEYKAEIGCAAENPAPNIQMVWYHMNPRNYILNYYDSNARIEAIKKIEFVVYSSYTWANSSTWYADIVLPLCHQFFEGGSGGSLSMENYVFHSHYSGNAGNYFIGGGKIIEPPGECRTKLWVNKEIANRLGIGDKYAPRIKDVPWEEFDQTLRDIAGEAYTTWAAWPNIEPLNPPTWEEFQKFPYFIRPIEGDYGVWMREHIATGEPLTTPSGKIEFYSDFLANKDYRHLPHRAKTFGKGTISPMGKYKDPPYSLLNPIVNTYPLYLITPHAFYRQHFCQDENPWFRDEYRMSVWVSAADAKARDIKDGDLVLVENNVGQVVLPAYVTSRLLPGVTCMIFGRQYAPNGMRTELMPDGIDRAGSSNFLVPDDHFDARRGPLLCNSMVQIKKFDEKNVY